MEYLEKSDKKTETFGKRSEVRKVLLIECTVAAGVMLMMMDVGIENGWTSPNLARFNSSNSFISLTDDQISWVASISGIGGIIGAFLASVCVTFQGSKRTIILTLLGMCFKWFLLIIAHSCRSSAWLYVFRSIGGVTSAMASGSFPLFLSEVSLAKVRGTLVTMSVLGLHLGKLLSTVIESYCEPTATIPVYLSLTAISLVIFTYLQESPYHLVRNNDTDGAEKSVAMYFPKSEIKYKLNEIKEFIAVNESLGFKNKLIEMCKPEVRRCILLIVLLFGLQMISGLRVNVFYMQIIVTKSKSTLVDPKNFVIITYTFTIAVGILTVVLIDKLGRRILFLTSGVGMAITMLGLGIHFYLITLTTERDATYLQWLPLICILLYNSAFLLGLEPVPYAVLGEIFPDNIKSLSPCIANLITSLFGFLSVKSYKPMVDTLGETWVYFIFAGCALFSVPITLFLLPETKGKSLIQIQNEIFKKS